MRLPSFQYLQPGDLEQALEFLSLQGENCRFLAGGTDILVRMKQGLLSPDYLISLQSIGGLSGIKLEDEVLKIGAQTRLADILASDPIRRHLPGFHEAIGSVGAPPIQHFRGTIGGNLCQETRCLFYNQSAFSRSVAKPCHKAGGKTCYAMEGSDRCRSTCQSDGAPPLIALNARVVLRRKGGTRTIDLGELYTGKGESPLALAPDELLTEIRVALPAGGSGNAYRRLSFRGAIDYPMVSAGVSLSVDDGRIRDARIVVGAVTCAPMYLNEASKSLEGKPAGDRTALETAAERAEDLASAFVAGNVNAPAAYRQRMIGVMVRRALESAVERAG